jgi:hypothetical protein
MKLLRPLLARFAVAAGVLLCLEAAFRAGAWELVAKPGSHAGTSITLKRELAKLGRPVDFVSLGSSMALWGFDHAQFSAAAARLGLTHVNLTMGGTHWLTLEVLVDWLRREHPELKGGVIAISALDFDKVGNGAYELGVAYPFKRFGDTERLSRYVPFTQSDLASYGTYSALFQYRVDLLDLIAHPRQRLGDLRSERLPASRWLFDMAPNPNTTCAVPTDRWESCVAHPPKDAAEAAVVSLCKSLGQPPALLPDIRGVAAGDVPIPPDLAQVKSRRVRQLRSIGWQRRPLVVLMPVHRLRLDRYYPVGTHAWALSVLQPLANEGVIDLLDYTALFDTPGGTDCRAFFDVFHLNAYGREQVMSLLLPEVQRRLYLPPVGEAAPR